MAGDSGLSVQMPSEMLLDRRVEGAAEIDSMLRRKDDLSNELSVSRIRTDIGELEDDGVVGNRYLSRVREARMRCRRYLDLDISFFRHR